MAKRCRMFSPEFKAKVVLKVLTRVKTDGQSCRDYRICSQLLSKRKAQFLENVAQVFEGAAD